MSKKKIEIIDIDLGIDIDEEIKKKVDSFNSDITLFTEKLIEREKVKQKKPISKKQLMKKERVQQTQKAIEILQNLYSEEDKWIKGWDLAQQSGLKPTPQNVNKLSMMVKKQLSEEKEWTLLKKRIKGKMRYRLAKFS